MASEYDWQAEPSQGGTTTFDLKRMIWGRKWLLVICTAVGVGIGYYQFTKQPEVFSSSGQVLLKRAHMPITVEGMKEATLHDPIDEHLERIRKGAIVDNAVKMLLESKEPIGTIEALGSPQQISAVISGRLRAVRPNARTNFISVTYTSPFQAECKPVLEAVLKSYEEYLSEDQRASSENLVSKVEEAQQVLDKDLKDKRDAYRNFRTTTSLLLNGEQSQNLHQQRVLEIEAERRQLLIRETEIQAELGAIESAQKRGTSRDVLMLVADQLNARSSKGPAGGTAATAQTMLTSQIVPLMVKEALLMEKLGQGHPEVRSIRKEIEVMERLLTPEGAEPGSAPTDILSLYVQALQEELRIVTEKEVKLTGLYVQEQAAARRMGDEEHKNREMLDDIQRTQALYDLLLSKMEQLNLVKSNDSYTLESITPPSGGYKSGPFPNSFVTMGGLGGMMAALFLSFLMELSDRSFRNANEINSVLGVPVIGHIPQIDGERGSKVVIREDIDRNLAVFQRPRSNVAESYRGVRTSLMFGLKDKSHTVIQVTSPDPGDGKSTLSSNLAASLAGVGKKVLLMDVDLRKPRQQKIFNYNLEDGGVSSVLSGTHTLEEARHETPIANLHVLTAGPRIDNPGEAIMAPEFRQLLSEAKEKYDFVIVDTPPVLPVTDAATIAPMVEGVVLVFRISKHSKPHSTEAVQALEMVSGNLLGVVVNGVGSHSGYQYGNSQYGYRYGKGYGRYESNDAEEPRRSRPEKQAS